MVLLLFPLIFLFVFGLGTAVGSLGIWLINAVLHYGFPAVPMLGLTKTVTIAAAFVLVRMFFSPPASVRRS